MNENQHETTAESHFPAIRKFKWSVHHVLHANNRTGVEQWLKSTLLNMCGFDFSWHKRRDQCWRGSQTAEVRCCQEVQKLLKILLLWHFWLQYNRSQLHAAYLRQTCWPSLWASREYHKQAVILLWVNYDPCALWRAVKLWLGRSLGALSGSSKSQDANVPGFPPKPSQYSSFMIC